MTQKFLLILLCTFIFGALNAQRLLSPSLSFSHKKTAYITLTDGTEIQGNIKDIDRKKGLIEFIKLKDGKGKKHKLDADKIKHMYLPPSGLDKLGKIDEMLFDADNWDSENLNKDYIMQGLVYFELSDVKIKKKNRKLLMQLLNPEFSKQVKIYHDPFAKETMSLGIGPVTAIGGDAKSYYLAKGDGAAYKVKKKNYKDEFKPLFQSCDEMIKTYTKPSWSDLVEHVIAFSNCQ